MPEIKINLKNLECGIERFKTLEQNWTVNNIEPPITVGGGRTVNEFEKLADSYKSFNAHMLILASKTAEFLTNIKESYIKNEQKAAKSFDK